MASVFIGRWLPPVIRQAANQLIGAATIYRGPYKDWATASRSTRGYNHQPIFERVQRATIQVLQGHARFEQDGVAISTAPPPSQALAGLLLAASLGYGRLSVLDFGGGLASHYLRWRPLLAPLSNVRWAVVEQETFVDSGNKLFATDPSLSFHKDIADVVSNPNVVLASSVLQYLPDPHRVLCRLADVAPRVIILDRTPYGVREAVVTQFVPPRLGKASYPLWILSRSRVHAALSKDYILLDEFDSADQPLVTPSIRASYHGSIWLRRV